MSGSALGCHLEEYTSIKESGWARDRVGVAEMVRYSLPPHGFFSRLTRRQ
jgi:hypothetical protein